MHMNNIVGKVAIVGAAESDKIGVVPDKSLIQLHAEAAHNALSEAGLTTRDVDAVFTAGPSPMETAEYLGIVPKFLDGTAVGGCSFLIHVTHAAMAIANGLCNVALITHGESGRSRVGVPSRAPAPQTMAGQFEAPWGLPSPVGAYAMACSRHMAKYGTTKEQLAQIAVSTRAWAVAVWRIVSSYAFMYWSQWARSAISLAENFQFLSGLSSRARKRRSCSFFDRWR
jgi:acetyl-CoA acetyltransferase